MNGESLNGFPVGTLIGGYGMTSRVVQVWDDRISLLRLTSNRGGFLKRPTERFFVFARDFDKLTPIDLTRDDVWTRALADRYGDGKH